MTKEEIKREKAKLRAKKSYERNKAKILEKNKTKRTIKNLTKNDLVQETQLSIFDLEVLPKAQDIESKSCERVERVEFQVQNAQNSTNGVERRTPQRVECVEKKHENETSAEQKAQDYSQNVEKPSIEQKMEVKRIESAECVEFCRVRGQNLAEQVLRKENKNYLLIAICFLLAFCAIVILQNDALNFYLSEKSTFTLWNMFSSVDGTNGLALLKSSVPEIFMFFIGISPAKGILSKVAKWSLILAIATYQIASVSMNTLESSQESIVEMKSKIQKQLSQSDVVLTLKKQESELANALILANKEGSANVWVIRSITRKLSETRENLRAEIQKQELIPVDEIQKKIERVKVKNLMFIVYRVIIFASSLFLMSFLSKLIFIKDTRGDKDLSFAN